MGLGIRGLVRAIRARHHNEEPSPVVASGLASVAAVTIANGADNISIYTPMFRTLGLGDSIITAATFTALVAVWCAAGMLLGSHKHVISTVGRFGHWIVPVVFIAIGAVIVIESYVVRA
jgi:cadmium resistance protein CadD (predicted permease)